MSIWCITRISIYLNVRHCFFICQIKLLMSYISPDVCTVQVTQTDESINNVCRFHFTDRTLPALSSFEHAIVLHREISWSQGTFKSVCVCICCLPFPWESSASTLWKCHWSPCLFRCVSLYDVCMRVQVCVDSLCRSSPKCLCVCLMCKCHWSPHFFHLITHACFYLSVRSDLLCG